MKENVETFYLLCPAWTPDASFSNTMERLMLQKDLPLMAKTAAAMRTRLDKEIDATRLQDYQVLWQREFLTHPPTEYDALRAQINRT